MLGQTNCHRCSGKIRTGSEYCNHCGCKQPTDRKNGPSERVATAKAAEPKPEIKSGDKPSRGGLIALVVGVVLVGAWLSSPMGESADPPPSNVAPITRTADSPILAEEPKYESLLLGSTTEWSAETSPDDYVRQAGPFLVRVTKSMEGDLVAPVVTVSANGQKIELRGSETSMSYAHKLSLFTNKTGAAPVLMLQSFTGGAHCCNEIQLAGFSNGRLTKVNLGSWDGDSIEAPRDLNGDGTADFVMSDNRFLYAFSSYASSYAPPQIFNVVGGKTIDVSKRIGFRDQFLETMGKAEQICVSGSSGDQRNGACPGYVAAASRVGKLEEAWPKMIGGYDAAAATDLPKGCALPSAETCPDSEQITFKSYPEALLYFLKDAGFISKNWVPPELRDEAGVSSEPDLSPEEVT